MNRTEYLLTVVAEEAVEVAQRATKAARFGLEEIQPGQDLNNRERMFGEFADLCGALELLFPHINLELTLRGLRPHIDAKKAKVTKFMAYSELCGTLQLSGVPESALWRQADKPHQVAGPGGGSEDCAGCGECMKEPQP